MAKKIISKLVAPQYENLMEVSQSESSNWNPSRLMKRARKKSKDLEPEWLTDTYLLPDGTLIRHDGTLIRHRRKSRPLNQQVE